MCWLSPHPNDWQQRLERPLSGMLEPDCCYPAVRSPCRPLLSRPPTPRVAIVRRVSGQHLLRAMSLWHSKLGLSRSHHVARDPYNEIFDSIRVVNVFHSSASLRNLRHAFPERGG